MIVLDEQLLGRDLEIDITKWYRGQVHYITDLRPGTVIKDEAIPGLLRHQNQPTFVTINERDFWRKIEADNRYCVVCFTLPDSRVKEISLKLRSLLQHPLFDTKSKRMGKVVRVTDVEVTFYTDIRRRVTKIRS